MAVNIFRYLGSQRFWLKQNMAIAVMIFVLVFWYTTHTSHKILVEDEELLNMKILAGLLDDVVDPKDNGARLTVAGQAPAVRNAVERKNDIINESSWLLLQEERKAAVKEACKDIPKDILYQTILTTRSSRDQLLVDDRHNAIYCFIPKVASLNWRRAWMILTGMASNTSDLLPKNIKSALEMKTLKYTEDVNELKHKFQTYKKVIVVRHPLERLLSVYFDEIQIPNLAPMVLPSVQKNRPGAKMLDIKWLEFVEYIIKEGVIDSKYWLTYEDLCHPCALDYDVIVKFETFNEDSKYFLKSINTSELVQIPEPSVDNPRVDSDKLKGYLADLSERQTVALKRKYNRDFLLFQYH